MKFIQAASMSKSFNVKRVMAQSSYDDFVLLVLPGSAFIKPFKSWSCAGALKILVSLNTGRIPTTFGFRNARCNNSASISVRGSHFAFVSERLSLLAFYVRLPPADLSTRACQVLVVVSTTFSYVNPPAAAVLPLLLASLVPPETTWTWLYSFQTFVDHVASFMRLASTAWSIKTRKSMCTTSCLRATRTATIAGQCAGDHPLAWAPHSPGRPLPAPLRRPRPLPFLLPAETPALRIFSCGHLACGL